MTVDLLCQMHFKVDYLFLLLVAKLFGLEKKSPLVPRDTCPSFPRLMLGALTASDSDARTSYAKREAVELPGASFSSCPPKQHLGHAKHHLFDQDQKLTSLPLKLLRLFATAELNAKTDCCNGVEMPIEIHTLPNFSI